MTTKNTHRPREAPELTLHRIWGRRRRSSTFKPQPCEAAVLIPPFQHHHLSQYPGTDEASGSADPRPPEVARATPETRRAPPPVKEHADTQSLADTVAHTTTPPGGALSNPTLCTSRDPGFPHPPAAGAAGGGRGNPRLAGERGGSTGRSPKIAFYTVAVRGTAERAHLNN